MHERNDGRRDDAHLRAYPVDHMTVREAKMKRVPLPPGVEKMLDLTPEHFVLWWDNKKQLRIWADDLKSFEIFARQVRQGTK